MLPRRIDSTDTMEEDRCTRLQNLEEPLPPVDRAELKMQI